MIVTVIDERPDYIIEIDRVLTEQQVAVIREVWARYRNVPEYWRYRGTSGLTRRHASNA